MPRWVDVRLTSQQAHVAILLVVETLCDHAFQFDPAPWASGPECELSVRDITEGDLLLKLADANINVLASRTRLGPGEPSG